MALTNSQFDAIMREYDERQLLNRHRLNQRIQEVYLKQPRLAEIDDTIASVSVETARKHLEGNDTALPALKAQLSVLRQEQNRLLSELGYPEDYLSPIYTCADCRDTGYRNGEKCHCLQQAILNVVYSQSNIQPILEKENFAAFTFDYYSDGKPNSATGLTSRQTAEDAVEKCRRFIREFDNKPQNLFFYGDTGVGKTFLSNCVAKELLDKGYSVIYFTAFQLFDTLSKGVFDRNEDAIAANENIFDCDLLIIDDLGTELSNAFTTSQLFLCVNERILRNRSTIISTNLNMNQLADIYSERTLSRISSNYTIIKLFGDDIRIEKRRRGV